MSDNPHLDQPVLKQGVPASEAAGAVVALHGRGATAEDIASISNIVPRHDLAWYAPQAAGMTWYPHSFLAPLQNNEPWLSSALALVGRIIEEIRGEGIAHEKIVLLGFSQGACLASEFAARNARRWGGVVAFSGGLIGSSQQEGEPPKDKGFEYDGVLDGTPVFLGCSDIDPHIPVERVHDTAAAFETLGADVTKEIYPGMGHTINNQEIQHMRDMLGRL